MNARSLLALVVATLALAACGTSKAERDKEQKKKIAQIGLTAIADDLNGEVQATARRISSSTDNGEIRRLMVVWQLRMLDNTRQSLEYPDPRWVFLDLWAIIFQTRQYIDTGDGKDLLGEHKSTAMESLDRMLDYMKSSAATVLTPKQLDDVSGAARKWAEEHPIQGNGMRRSTRPSPTDEGGGVFGALSAVPSEIFALGGGVKDSAAAISDVAVAAERATNAVEVMPLTVRLQTELLLYALDEDPTVKSLLANMDTVSTTVESVGQDINALPSNLQETIVKTIEEVESTQPEFRKTLVEGRGIVDQTHATVKEVRGTLKDLEETGTWLEKTTANATTAGDAWEGAFGQLNLIVNPPKDPDEPPSEPAPPFDIKDAAKTAEWVAKAGAELKETVVEVRKVIEGEGIDDRLKQIDTTTKDAVDHTTTRAGLLVDEVIDRLTVRAVIVILVFFAALLGYKLVAARIPRRQE